MGSTGLFLPKYAPTKKQGYRISENRSYTTDKWGIVRTQSSKGNITYAGRKRVKSNTTMETQRVWNKIKKRKALFSFMVVLDVVRFFVQGFVSCQTCSWEGPHGPIQKRGETWLFRLFEPAFLTARSNQFITTRETQIRFSERRVTRFLIGRKIFLCHIIFISDSFQRWIRGAG